MYLLCILPLLLATSKAQYIVTTSVDPAGNTYWSASVGAPRTSVRALPSVPTLVYNCAIVPALCQNVAQLRPGAQNGGHNELFGWDPDGDRKILRREKICPGSWKTRKSTRCPRPDQPPIHPLGVTDTVPPEVDQKDFAVLRVNSNAQLERTGIIMTCDEFPPAMSIQGGIGPGKKGTSTGVTYCAPMSYSCSSIHNVDFKVGKMPGIPSEQNWQSQGHSFLSHVVAETDTDIWTYRLQTVVLPPQEQVAVFVKYTRKGAAPTTREFIGGKRDTITSGEAVFGVFNTSAQFHLEIPQGHTAEGVIRLHQRSGLHSHHALTKTLPLYGPFDHFELRQNIRTARRMLKSGSPGLQDQRFNVSTTKQRQTEANVLQNTTSTVQDSITARGPAQQDPRVDPPVPILQIGLEYTLQDTYYATSNISRLPKRQALKKSFQPLNPADPDLYSDFTSLKTDTLKTWIAIGGFDFSNSDATTHTTWSDMVATQANRASFIRSLISFMDKYGFQGADFDWEYPAAEARGGKPEDTQNLVLLMKETRAAFGTEYGLSIILAPDYWYLRGMDPKEMEQYVDWFGFMAYDLHGAWDAEVKTIGALVRPQTDLREITNNTLPLWFDKLDPAKVNLGLAYYGRGFTLTDKSCNYMGCSFTGPSKSGSCTNSPGVMSNREIMQLIKKKNLTPTLIREAQVKQITWEDQWMGYDDDETIAAKIRTANSLCLGGTMIWSIDFDSGSGSGDIPDKGFGTDVTGPSSGGGNNPGSGSSGNSGGGSSGNGVGSGVVYVDGTVWTDPQPPVACEPPCVLILPPIQLPSSTVITFPALTTAYVTNTFSSDAAGQGALPTLLTVTTVIAIPPVTTTEIEVWAITIFPSDPTDATFTPVQSAAAAADWPVVVQHVKVAAPIS
ncbi:MAG: hypothetical protein Q9193_004497 [Seirophora villosa]